MASDVVGVDREYILQALGVTMLKREGEGLFSHSLSEEWMGAGEPHGHRQNSQTQG